ncbi:MAG: DUF1761 domain-containing protein [Chitinophagales bacterium]
MEINWIAILVGALIPMIMGFIWYSPMLFGKAWMASIGKTEADLKQTNMAVTLGISFILAAILSFFLYSFIGGLHDYIYSLEGEGDHYPHNFLHGTYHGAFAAIVMAIPVLVTNSLFEQRNWTNILINGSYWVITITLMGGVISLLL